MPPGRGGEGESRTWCRKLCADTSWLFFQSLGNKLFLYVLCHTISQGSSSAVLSIVSISGHIFYEVEMKHARYCEAEHSWTSIAQTTGSRVLWWQGCKKILIEVIRKCRNWQYSLLTQPDQLTLRRIRGLMVRKFPQDSNSLKGHLTISQADILQHLDAPLRPSTCVTPTAMIDIACYQYFPRLRIYTFPRMHT